MKPSFVTVSAQPGSPSIYWIGKSGRQYRKLVAAKIDKQQFSIGYKPAENKPAPENNLLLKILLAVGVVLIIYKLIK